ncbi:hypothetical protein ACOME3_004476 [Neoechinorhynchus agilis]
MTSNKQIFFVSQQRKKDQINHSIFYEGNLSLRIKSKAFGPMHNLRIVLVLLSFINTATRFYCSYGTREYFQKQCHEPKIITVQQIGKIAAARNNTEIIGIEQLPFLHRLFNASLPQSTIIKSSIIPATPKVPITECASEKQTSGKSSRVIDAEQSPREAKVIGAAMNNAKKMEVDRDLLIRYRFPPAHATSTEALISSEGSYERKMAELASQCGYVERMQMLSDLLCIEKLKYLKSLVEKAEQQS